MSYQSIYSGKEVDESVLNYLYSRVNTLDELNALDTSKLKDGWKCYVISTDTEYKWKDGKWNKLSSLDSLITDNYSEQNRTGSKIDRDGANIDKVQIMNFIRSINYIVGNSGFNISQEGTGEFQNIISNLIAILRGGLRIGTYSKGLSGAIIDALGNGEMESLTIRSFLDVFMLVFNKMEVVASEFCFTEGGTIESILSIATDSNGEKVYTVKMHKRYDNDLIEFAYDDILKCVVNNILNKSYTQDGETVTPIYYTAWLYVISVDQDAYTMQVKMYSDPACPSGRNFEPAAQMSLKRFGNRSNTSRQSCWYISTVEKCLVFLDGVTQPILTDEPEGSNFAAFFGIPIQGKYGHDNSDGTINIDGNKIYALRNQQIDINAPYFYVKGAAIQDLIHIDYNGIPVRTERMRGEWSLDNAQSDSYKYQYTDTIQDIVYHNGCKFGCILTGTTEEPMYGASDWIFLSGDPTLYVEITSTKGSEFDFGDGENTTLIASAKMYNQDVTAYLSTAIWTRDSGNTNEDAAWNAAHSSSSRELYVNIDLDKPVNGVVVYDGVGSNFIVRGYTIFTCTMTLNDGTTESGSIAIN